MEKEFESHHGKRSNNDEVKDLKSQLDETQKIIEKLSKLKETPEDSLHSSKLPAMDERRLSNTLRELLEYKPKLPENAEYSKIVINIKGESINMIINLINNFLEFLKERCAIVYREYDSYLEMLLKLTEIGDRDPKIKVKLDEILHGENSNNGLYKSLLSGTQFVVLLKNLIVRALTEMANVVNKRIMERRELLLSQREEIAKIYDIYVREGLRFDDEA